MRERLWETGLVSGEKYIDHRSMQQDAYQKPLRRCLVSLTAVFQYLFTVEVQMAIAEASVDSFRRDTCQDGAACTAGCFAGKIKTHSTMLSYLLRSDLLAIYEHIGLPVACITEIFIRIRPEPKHYDDELPGKEICITCRMSLTEHVRYDAEVVEVLHGQTPEETSVPPTVIAADCFSQIFHSTCIYRNLRRQQVRPHCRRMEMWPHLTRVCVRE
jgi:hypothetical protein